MMRARYNAGDVVKQTLALALLVIATSANASLWEYTENVDRMSGKKSRTAVAESDNSLSLAFPYQGQNKGQIVIRQHPQYGLDVIFKIDKGQLMCRTYEPCRINVKFGDAKPITFNGTGAADHDSTVAFLSSPQRFIESAQKTQNILVQFTVYNGGTNILEFSFPAPLKWTDKAPKK